MYLKKSLSPHHSVETAHFKVTIDLQIVKSSGQVSISIILDLSAVFDTGDSLLLLDIFSIGSAGL